MTQERNLADTQLIGLTAIRDSAWQARYGVGFGLNADGTAWWDNGSGVDSQGRPNHFEQGIPVETVKERLFNWEPVILNLTGDHNGTKVPTRFQAIYRPDTGVVFDRAFAGSYKIHSYNEWLLDNVATILDDNLVIGSAGLLKDGQIAYVQVQTPEAMEVEGVKFSPFITAASSMNGMIATQYRKNVQVAVCDNTLSAALSEKSDGVIKFRHTKGSLTQVSEARDALGVIFETADEFSNEVRRLTSEKVSDARFNRWATIAADIAKAKAEAAKAGKESTRGLTGAEKKRDELLTLWKKDERVHPWHGTAYGVVAAWNTWVHHFQGVKGQTRNEANQLRVVRGYVGKEDQYALDLLKTV